MVNGFSLADISEKTQEVLAIAIALACRDRKGGYLCIMEENLSTPLLVARIGVVETEGKAAKYFGLAQEKGRRLFITSSHRSSWESRQEIEGRYGGAIRAGGFIISFSGLTESADEVVSLGLAYILGLADKSEIFAIAKISANPHIEDFWKLIVP